jgi:hypothetical protein
MDERIGRRAASFGVDRTATAKAVRIVERQPLAARPAQCAREFGHSVDPLRTIRGTPDSFKLGSICVSFNNGTTGGNRRSTATERLMCVVAAVTGGADGHARERARESAAGEIAGAILGRSQQV